MSKLFILLTTTVAGSISERRSVTVDIRGNRAKMNIYLGDYGCQHRYEGPVDPRFPVNAVDGEEFGEGSIRIDVRRGDSIPESGLCLPQITADSPRCVDCSFTKNLYSGSILCTYGRTHPELRGVALTYWFDSRTMYHREYWRKWEELYNGKDSLLYNRARHKYNEAQLHLSEFTRLTEYVLEPRPRGWIRGLIWSAKANLHQSVQRAEASARERQRLQMEVAAKKREWDEQQAIRQVGLDNLKAEQERMEADLSPRLCEAMRVDIWQLILPRIGALRLADKQAQERIPEWMRREAAERERGYLQRGFTVSYPS